MSRCIFAGVKARNYIIRSRALLLPFTPATFPTTRCLMAGCTVEDCCEFSLRSGIRVFPVSISLKVRWLWCCELALLMLSKVGSNSAFKDRKVLDTVFLSARRTFVIKLG